MQRWGWEGGMASKTRMAIVEGPISDRDFERLLRAASNYPKLGRPYVLKKITLPRRKPASAA